MTETDTAPMTGAALKVALGGLGLPPSWFAAKMNVTMRTVVRWFDAVAVEQRIADEVEHLSEKTLETMLAMIDDVPAEGDVVLKTYRTDAEFKRSKWPAEWHRALVFRVAEHLRSEGRDVTIEYT